MAGLRVVLDTGALVAGMAYPASAPGRIMNAWRRASISLVLSSCILDEMAQVLPCLSRIKMSAEEIRDLADSFLFLCEIVEPAAEFEPELRNWADLPVLGTLIAAKADYLISADKDMLALAGQYPIVTSGEFWSRHGNY